MGKRIEEEDNLNEEVDIQEEEFDTEEVETSEESDGGEESEDEATSEEEEGETIVMIGDEEPEEEETKAPDWVRELRQRNKELAKRNKELERMHEEASGSVDIVVGKKPSLDDPDIDYDTELFEQKLEEYHERKRQADEQANKRDEEKKAVERAWNDRLATYNEKKVELGVKDYDDVEDSVRDILNETQQGIIVHGAENSALVVYALGKNPSKARELAAISDPVQFAFAVAKLESTLKVGKRKPSTSPERVPSGTAPKSGVVDTKLKRLEEEAERTGDRSKILAYKREKRRKQG